MNFNWFERSAPAVKFILSIACMFGFLAIGILLSWIIAIPFFGLNEMFNNDNIVLLKYYQTIQSITLFILPPICLAILFGQKPGEYLFYSKKPRIQLVIYSIILILVVIPIINFTQEINSKLSLPSYMAGIEEWLKSTEGVANQLTEKFMSVTSAGGLLVNILIMAIIPAIGEELTFRGLFQRLFTEWFKNYHWGIITSAALFSAFHFQFYGFIPRMILGVLFGYMLVWSKSIWFPIIAHFINNTMGVTYYFLYKRNIIDNKLETIGAQGSNVLIYVFISFVLTSYLLYLFKENSKEKYEVQ